MSGYYDSDDYYDDGIPMWNYGEVELCLELSEAKQELDKKNDYITSQDQKMRDLQENLESTKAEVRRLNQSVAHKTVLTNSLASRTLQLNNFKKQNVNLQKEKKELHDILGNMVLSHTTSANRTTLSNELKTAQAQIVEHKQAIAELKSYLDLTKLTKKYEELTDAKVQIQKLNHTNSCLNGSLKKSQADVVNLNKLLNKKNGVNDELKWATAELNTSKRTIEENKIEMADKDAIIQVLKGDNRMDKSDGIQLACSICTSEFLQNDNIVATRCGHIYHNDCLRPWLNTCVYHLIHIILLANFVLKNILLTINLYFLH